MSDKGGKGRRLACAVSFSEQIQVARSTVCRVEIWVSKMRLRRMGIRKRPDRLTSRAQAGRS